MATGMEGMEMTMSYPVAKVLTALKKNRKQHAEDYEKAMKGYRKKRSEALVEAGTKFLENFQRVTDLDKKDADFELEDLLDDVELQMSEPVEYLSHYDDYIEQLEMTSQEEIQFSRTMFKQLVQNEWEWVRSYNRTNSAYLAG